MAGKQPTVAILEQAVELACHAPSIHNSQPWRWIALRRGLQLHLDPDRLVATDGSGRQALLSCGAVLDHLRAAMAAAGWAACVEYFPNPNDPEHLASIDFEPMPYVTNAHRRRAKAILCRRSDRLPFRPPPNWPVVETLLRNAVDAGVVMLDVVKHDDRNLLAEASALTESLRQYDSDYHAELDWWTGPFGDSDGIPHSSLVSAAESDRVDIGRLFPITSHRAERRLGVPEDCSEIIVLSTYGESRRDMVCCGEALSQLLLEAEMNGLATCTLTHLIEVDVSRGIVRSLVHRDFPQVLVRVGAVPPQDDLPAATPRRPIDDVLQIRLQ